MKLELNDIEQAKLDTLFAALKEAETGYTNAQAQLAKQQADLSLLQGRYLGAIEMVAANKDHVLEDVEWVWADEHVTLNVK